MVGSALLRRVIRKPEFELAGVLAWSESKVGKDAGDLVGLGPTGITVTGDPEEIYALDVDCVLHTPKDPGDFRSDGEIIRLLESGKNVITALPYQWPELRGEEIVKKLEAEVRRALADAGVRDKLKAMAVNPGGGAGEEFRKLIDNDIKKFAENKPASPIRARPNANVADAKSIEQEIKQAKGRYEDILLIGEDMDVVDYAGGKNFAGWFRVPKAWGL